MFDKDAIKELAQAEAITAAAGAVHNALGRADSAAIALPDDFHVHDLEKYQEHRRRARGAMSTSVVADFAAYVEKHNDGDGSAVFVDPDAMKAKAVLNLGTPDLPGHADNLAIYTAKATAAYRALVSHTSTNGGLSQKAVAEFLEDWAPHIACRNDNGAEIRLPQAIAAVRRITIESAKKLEATVASLSETRSAMESVTASSVEPLPTFIDFKCVPYKDLAERTFTMRLGILTGQVAPMLQLRIQLGERHTEEMAQELAQLVREAFGDSMPVHIGTYSPA